MLLMNACVQHVSYLFKIYKIELNKSNKSSESEQQNAVFYLVVEYFDEHERHAQTKLNPTFFVFSFFDWLMR